MQFLLLQYNNCTFGERSQDACCNQLDTCIRYLNFDSKCLARDPCNRLLVLRDQRCSIDFVRFLLKKESRISFLNGKEFYVSTTQRNYKLHSRICIYLRHDRLTKLQTNKNEFIPGKKFWKYLIRFSLNYIPQLRVNNNEFRKVERSRHRACENTILTITKRFAHVSPPTEQRNIHRREMNLQMTFTLARDHETR